MGKDLIFKDILHHLCYNHPEQSFLLWDEEYISLHSHEREACTPLHQMSGAQALRSGDAKRRHFRSECLTEGRTIVRWRSE